MKKLLLITSLLILALTLSTVCFAAGRDTSNYVMSVSFVIDEPYPGRSLDFTADSSSGVVVESVIWQKEGEINDAGTNTQVTAGKWNLRITFSLASGKTGISTNNIVSINDKSGLNWSKDENGKYYVETSYDITASTGSRPSTSTGTFTRPSTGSGVTRPTSTTISTVEFTIPELKVGEKQIEKDAITTTTGISITNMSWTNVTGKAFMTTNETYRENYKYSIRVYFTVLSGYKLADSFEVKVNGDKVNVTSLDDGSGKYLFDKEFTCGKKETAPELETKESISKVEITVPDVVQGNTIILEKDIKLSKGAKYGGHTWSNGTTFMSDDEKYEEGKKYTLKYFFDADTGYEFKNLKVILNGEEIAPTLVTAPNYYSIEKTFEAKKATVETPVLKTIDITVAEPEVGKALPGTYKVSSNLVEKASEYKIGEKKEDNLGEWTPNDKEVKAGTEYVFKLDIELKNSMAEISKDLKITLNKKVVKPTIKDGVYTVEYPFETAEEKQEMINHFAFEIAAPKIGEKPATTAKETEEGYKVKKVEWLTKDEKFVEGETYKVQIYFDLINKNVRSDYFATVNGNDADLPDGDANYAKNTMYAEFTFPTLRDTSKKATWSNASTWAIDELAKAAEEGLIPDSLNKEDLTKNITRKEFAHIAVRLYEAITGKGIFVTNAPFSDTDDVEVAKAYTVGITEGTDKEKGLFSPDKEITREQMATMMTRALDKAYIDTFVDLDKVSKFVDDGDLHDWSRSAVYFMNSKDIIKGVSTTENKFGAKGTASREQALLIAIRSVEKFAK